MTTMPQPTVIPTIALMETVIPWLLPPSVVGEADEEVSADVGEAWGSVRDVEVGIKDDDGDDDVMIGEDITGSPRDRRGSNQHRSGRRSCKCTTNSCSLLRKLLVPCRQ